MAKVMATFEAGALLCVVHRNGGTGNRIDPSFTVVTKQWSGPRLLQLVLLSSVVVCAGERWSSKDYTQWSAEEVNRLLTDSPWAKQVSASFSIPHREEDHAVIPPPGRQLQTWPALEGVTDGNWDGGVGQNIDDSAPTLPVTIRWDSALPVRQALLRSRSGDHGPELRTQSKI